MKESVKSEEQYQEELLELHERLVEMEKLEIERERSDMTAEEFEKKCHKLFDKANEGITIIQDQRIKYANSLAAEIVGYSAEEITGTLFAHYIHPDELPRVVEYYKQRLAGKDAPAIYETTVKHKSGHKVPVEIKVGIISYLGKPAEFAVVRITSK